MTTYVALLRAVNVGGRKVAMTDLRALLDRLGLEDARTLLQTGNAVFRTAENSAVKLERTLEEEGEKAFGLKSDFILRTAEEMRAVVERNPFPEEAKSDPAHLVVTFLKSTPADGAEEALREAIRGPERVRVVGREAYLVYPAGIGVSKLTLPLIEKMLGTRGTGRNWNTVTRLAALAT